MKQRIYHITALGSWLLAISLFAVSCADSLDYNNKTDNRKIRFHVSNTTDWKSVDEDTQTRAIALNEELSLTTTVENGFDGEIATRGTATTVMPNAFALSAYTYTGGSTPNWSTYFSGETAQLNGSNWEIANQQYWPNVSDFLRFYGYAPAGGSGISYIAGNNNSGPRIDFTVQNTVANQIDLMTSSTNALRYKSGIEIEMPFRHALTCVKFSVGNGLTNYTIKEVTMKRIVTHATYDFDGGWTSGTATADTTDFELAGIGFSSPAAGTQIVYDEAKGGASALTFLMIPQAFNKQEQLIEVVYNTGSGSDVTARATLQGSTWLAGTTVTYRLTMTGEYEYILTATPANIDHDGGTTTFSVTSYRQSGNNAPEPLDWRIIGYSTDGVNFTTAKPSSCSWAAFHSVNGLGGSSAETCKVSIDAQTKNATSPIGATDDASIMAYYLARYDEQGSDANNPYDLSTHNLTGDETTQNTANCYVVNAPGWYKLPLVYGNAIKNGTANSQAYTPATGNIYPDHAGTAITQPYIYNLYTPQSATLIWQDAEDLITPTSVALCDIDGNGKYTYLKFYIAPEDIRPGNAIVAVKGSTDIMWSWHIWVTDVDINKTAPIANYENQTFNLMPVDLGWCSTGSNADFYSQRVMYARIMQDGGNTAILKVTQRGATVLHSETGYAPFYQAGRKDPMQPGSGVDNTDHTVYGPYLPDYSVTALQTIPFAIKNPNKYISCDGNWVPWRSDLWCAGSTATDRNNLKIQKTIYDPCPVGFHVPECKTFTGTTNDGDSRANTKANAVAGIRAASWSKGYYFYTRDGGSIHIPAIGVRDNTAARFSPANNPSIGKFGWYANRWTATSYKTNTYYGHYLFVTQIESNRTDSGYEWINPFGSDNTGNGNPIRPVADY